MLAEMASDSLGFLLTGWARSLPAPVVKGLAAALFSRSWSAFEKATADPQSAQRDRLLAIIARNRDTWFGREHGFSSIRTIADFQRQVPVRNYDGFEPYIDRMLHAEPNVLVADRVTYFARTSGTTGAAKYVPVTSGFLEEYRSGRRVWTRQVVRSFPGLLRGAVLSMQSPRVDGQTPGGTPYGALAVALSGEPGALQTLLKGLEPVPAAAFLLADYETRYYLILRLAAAANVSLMAAINPSTLVLLCQKLTQFAPVLIDDCRRGTLTAPTELRAGLRAPLAHRLRPAPAAADRMQASLAAHGRVRPIDLWPNLCGLLCWKGGSAPFYLRQFPQWFGDLPVMDYCYAATEGNFSVVLSPAGDQGVLAVDGHFLEFVPEDQTGRDCPDALTAPQLESGQRYRLVLTASNGLYRYDINDVIEVVGRYRQTPEVVFCQKGGNSISITGEKVTESQVVRAVSLALRRCNLEGTGFCVTVRLDSEKPRYVFAIEPSGAVGRGVLGALLSACDQELQAANIEYQAKRQSQRLAAPELVVVAPGEFERRRKRRLDQGAFDSQLKLPHLQPEPQSIEDLVILDRWIGETLP